MNDHVCRRCGSAVSRVVWVKDGVDVCHCSCGLFFAALAPTGDEIRSLYGREYFQKSHASAAGRGYDDYQSGEAAIRLNARRVIARILRYLGRRPEAVLDVGCATGVALGLWREEGARCVGVEISEDMAHVARIRADEVIADDVLNVDLGRERFDVVTLLDQIEHSVDPFGQLDQVYTAIKPGGVLYLTTGDIGSWPARVAGVRWHLLTVPEHLFFFSAAVMRQVLTACGFVDIRIGHPGKIVPLGFVLDRVGRLAGIRPHQPLVRRIPLPVFVNSFDIMHVLARKGEG